MYDAVLYLLELREVRFLVAGALATLLYYAIFAPLAFSRLHYLACATYAFVPSFALNFLLQKFWAFESVSIEVIHRELALFVLKNLIFFVFNGFLLYVLVTHVRRRLLTAQVITTIILTPLAYIVYEFIFNH